VSKHKIGKGYREKGVGLALSDPSWEGLETTIETQEGSENEKAKTHLR